MPPTAHAMPSILPRAFMNADAALETAPWVLVGIPYDGTCSYRPGTRFGPSAIREASWGVEGYDPLLNRSLENVSFADAGDLELPMGNRDKSLALIREAAQHIVSNGQHWVGLGGEHLVTYPVIQAYIEKYPDLVVIQFDAHADLRQDYLGEPLSHATVMQRVVGLVGPTRLYQIGIRSGTQWEFDWMRTHNSLITDKADLKTRLAKLGDTPIFLTIDLDVLDPSILPGTGTPEPGGFSFKELQEWLLCLDGCNIVGFDALELSPPWDASAVSNVVAAKVIRHCLLLANS